jgi:hypothetical protein
MERARRTGVLFRPHPGSRGIRQVQRLGHICDQRCDVGTATTTGTAAARTHG